MAARKSRSTAKAARPTTVAAYLDSLTPEKRAVIEEARALVHKHISKGYAEFMNWGVINWESHSRSSRTRTTASRSATSGSARRRATTRSI